MAGFFKTLKLKSGARSQAKADGVQTKWIDADDPRIAYYLRPRARRISIKIDASKREVMVTVPRTKARLNDAQNFVRDKYDWILVQLEALPPAQPFVDGGFILFHGDFYQLLCPSPRGRPFIDHDKKHIYVPASPDTLEGRTKRFLIREARQALTQATQVHAGTLGKTIDKISVRDTSSRWGSCKKGSYGAGGQISYSWRLVCAPPYVLDYVTAHECAHLVEANHGAGFWALCDSLVDTTAPAKHWLSQNGAQLHAVGAQQ